MLRLFAWFFALFMFAELPGQYNTSERAGTRLVVNVPGLSQHDLISPFDDLQRLKHAPTLADHAASHLDLFSDESNDRLLADARTPRVPIDREAAAAFVFELGFHSLQPRNVPRARAPPALV